MKIESSVFKAYPSDIWNLAPKVPKIAHLYLIFGAKIQRSNATSSNLYNTISEHIFENQQKMSHP